MSKTSLLAIPIALVVLAVPEFAPLARAYGSPAWRRTDTRRCRIHWSDATAWVAARVERACDEVADTVAPGDGVLDVVIEDTEGRPTARGGVAHLPGSIRVGRRLGPTPAIVPALARALAEAAVQTETQGIHLELSALGADSDKSLHGGGRATLGRTGDPPWRALSDAQCRAERAAGAGWTTGRDMVLRMAILSGGTLSTAELALPLPRSSPGVLRSIQAHSIGRFLFERSVAAFDRPDEDDGLFADWLARASAIYADQIDEIGPEIAGSPLDGALRGPVATASGQNVDRIRLSPDGRWVAWTDADQGLVAPWGTSKELPAHITRMDAPGGLDFSPESDRLVTADGQLFVVGVTSGERRRLTRGLRASDPAWSPTGDRIAFVHRRDGRSSLGLVDPDRPEAGLTWILAPQDGAWIGRPRWSADSKWLVFEMYRAGRWDLWAVGRGGGDLRPLTWDDARERDPVIDPRGRAVWFTSDASGVSDLRRLDLLTGRVERMTNVHGGAFSPAIASDGALLYLYYSAKGFELRRIASPAPLEQWSSPRPGALEVARSLLPEIGGPVLSAQRAGWSLLPASVTPMAIWDQGLSAGLRVGSVGPDRERGVPGPTATAHLLVGSSIAAGAHLSGGGAWSPFLSARWLATDRSLAGATDQDDDPQTLGHARAVSLDGAAHWGSVRAGVDVTLSSALRGELFVDLLRTGGDARITGGVERSELTRLGGAAALIYGTRSGNGPTLRLEQGFFASDLAAPVWDAAETLGGGDAAGGVYDYHYARTVFEATVPLFEHAEGSRLELRLRGGWIGRNVTAEEELFAGILHPADRFRPLRTAFGLAGYDEFAIHGETLALAGLAWRSDLPAGWRGAVGPLALAGGFTELFADTGNAWGYSARWQRSPGGALLTDGDGRPLAASGAVRRTDPFREPGAAGPRLITEVGVEVGLALRLFHAPWGSTFRVAYGFQSIQGPGDTNGDGVVVRSQPDDPLAGEVAPAGLRLFLAVGTGFE